MADNNTQTTEDTAPALAEVTGPSNMVVGDENAPDVRPVEPEVTKEDAPAYNMGEEDRSVDTVPVHEVYVAMDEVDLNGPVVVPDAGRGSLDLPIHSLSEGTVEDKFASGDNDEEARTLPGTSVGDEEEKRTDKPKAAPKAADKS